MAAAIRAGRKPTQNWPYPTPRCAEKRRPSPAALAGATRRAPSNWARHGTFETAANNTAPCE
eukprot:6635487-Lingulodinium_polyedra.AAC.1